MKPWLIATIALLSLGGLAGAVVADANGPIGRVACQVDDSLERCQRDACKTDAQQCRHERLRRHCAEQPDDARCERAHDRQTDHPAERETDRPASDKPTDAQKERYCAEHPDNARC